MNDLAKLSRLHRRHGVAAAGRRPAQLRWSRDPQLAFEGKSSPVSVAAPVSTEWPARPQRVAGALAEQPPERARSGDQQGAGGDAL